MFSPAAPVFPPHPRHSALVGEPDFASAVPLAASGIGEPFVSASGVLALMTLWRCGYALYLDPFSLKGLGFRRQQFLNELYRWGAWQRMGRNSELEHPMSARSGAAAGEEKKTGC